MVAPAEHTRFKEFLRNYAKSADGDRNLEVQGLRPDGSGFNALMEFSPATYAGEACTQIIIRDQSISRELEKKIKHLSKQDLLTGLYNRQYFLEELEQAVEEKTGAAVLYLLLDNFKTIKESVGIAGSDLVLGDIANLIRARIDAKDIAARFSDNAFTVLTHHAHPLDAAELLRTAVEDHIADVNGQSVATTCSIGVARISDGPKSAQDLLGRADLACDLARTAGGNRVHVHNPVADLQVGKEKERKWTTAVRAALDQDRFRLVFQPIVSLQGSPGEQYEVLLRMLHDDGAYILPGDFFPPAEEVALITAIDRWVIAHAILSASEQRRTGKAPVLFIKITGPSLADETLLPWISEQLKAARVPGDSLVFEISEQTAVTCLKDAKTFAKGVHELRCGLAMEHFGKGDNAFHLLKHVPADYLKLDGSLMHHLAENTESQDRVKSIADSAHAMNKATIAAFVEDAASLSVLWQLGVKYIQGKFLLEPYPTMSYEFAEESA
jgi:diguanylate cyclase (GGDEF)-like protein